MVLAENLKKNNIIIKAKARNRWELLDEMIELAVKNREIGAEDREDIRNALIEREKSMSTGIGNGVAVPHCTTSKINDIVIIMAVSQKGLDFDSIDSHPVRIVILLIVPKKKLSQHIKTLANIAKIMNDEVMRDSILEQKNAESVLKIIRSASAAK
jgi:fructose-specific phosphotransferase system IIA component